MKMRVIPALMLALSTLVIPASTQTAPKAVKGYSVSVFTKGVTGQYTAPDSIAVLGDHIFIGYGDGNDPAGLDGKSNQIVEYDMSGQTVHVFTVLGHNDGLKVNPLTHQLWAMQNEDGNPSLVIIDPVSMQQSVYTFAAPPPHGGGYDDIVFRDGKVYFSASNPAMNPNAAPAIVEAKLTGNSIEVTSALEGNATATDMTTGASVTLNLQDPDSMTLTPSNDILLDSQGDSELVLLHSPGKSNQHVLVVPLSSPLGTPQADDTLFIPSDEGSILMSDTPNDTVYMIRRSEFVPGTAYSAAVGAPDQSGATVGFVGRLDLSSGEISPIVTGFGSPHGMAFVKTGDGEE
jgi:hypothetical protein